jgi:hypothetical protein
VNLYESQKELHTVLVHQAADALIYRAAAELVNRAVDDALTSLDRISSTRSLTADRISSTRSLTLSPHEALERCVVCRTFPCECRDDVEDECMVCNEVPCIRNDPCTRSLTAVLDLQCFWTQWYDCSRLILNHRLLAVCQKLFSQDPLQRVILHYQLASLVISFAQNNTRWLISRLGGHLSMPS